MTTKKETNEGLKNEENTIERIRENMILKIDSKALGQNSIQHKGV